MATTLHTAQSVSSPYSPSLFDTHTRPYDQVKIDPFHVPSTISIQDTKPSNSNSNKLRTSDSLTNSLPLMNLMNNKVGGNEGVGLLERYYLLAAHESRLVQQLKSTMDCSSLDVAPLIKILANDLQTVLTHKINEVKTLVGEEEVLAHNTSQSSKKIPSQGAPVPIKRELNSVVQSSPLVYTNPVLFVEEQPTGNVVANKYLEPALVVKVDDIFKESAREGKLQIAASLSLTLTDEIISRTIDNKQDILQGQTMVPVTAEGYATFNKLKIMEVSSKHHHQAFSIQLQLQEIRNSCSSLSSPKSTPVGEAIKLAPLHVQSRINKRKRSCFSHGRPRKRARSEFDCNYVDITSLLVLPQKEAATRLGISESMLCKRFKECTRRKWPYRYLRKIDKMIRVLTLNKKSDSIPREDQEKIQRLKREREECLHPVKIRITGNDKLTTRRITLSPPADEDNDNEDIEDDTENDTTPIKSKEPSDSDSETSNSSQPCEEEEIREDDDEIAQVASTLNLLKQGTF